MSEYELDQLISDSLKHFADTYPEPPDEEEHVFSKDFEKRMAQLLYQKERHRLPLRRQWFVLIAVLLAMLACSLTVYGSKTSSIHFFADNFSEYASMGEMSEDMPERMRLIYGLEGLQAKYAQGVDIRNDEQYTRFFLDEESGRFLEFSSYPRLMFRYHVNTELLTSEPLDIEGKDAVCYTDPNGMQYIIIWSMDASVFVVRSNFEKTELIEAVNSIEIYETPLQ